MVVLSEKSKLALLLIGVIVSVFAVVLQFYLMMESRITSITETIVRFFSFFTILTNSIVAIYFIIHSFFKGSTLAKRFSQAGSLTAITVYITIVGLVYQFLLRHLWAPQGWQRLADELLHFVIPIYCILYWGLTEKKKRLLHFGMLPAWLVYPLVYLLYILIRGSFSDFYPYPFLDVTKLGYQQVWINSTGMVLLFTAIAACFILIPKIKLRAR